jgi:exonuclease III
MKIISWNWNGAFRRKYNYLERFYADILLIQECENPALSNNTEYKSWAKNHLWVGNNKNSGLGVFVKDTEYSQSWIGQQKHSSFFTV